MKTKFLIIGVFPLLLAVLMLGYANLQVMGLVSSSNSSVAKRCLAFAGSLGDARASHALASLRVFASDDPDEMVLGVTYLAKEYAEGSAYSAGKLGWAYQRGLGVSSDLGRAVELYQYAASRGMTYWQFLLAHAYEEGYLGFAANEEQSQYWLMMEPKVHAARYECWIAQYYRDGIFPQNQEKLDYYAGVCRGGTGNEGGT